MWINAALLNQMARRCNYWQSQSGPGDLLRQTVMKPRAATASGVLETNKISLGKWMFPCHKKAVFSLFLHFSSICEMSLCSTDFSLCSCQYELFKLIWLNVIRGESEGFSDNMIYQNSEKHEENSVTAITITNKKVFQTY